MERRIELIEPSGRRLDLTPLTARRRIARAIGITILLALSAVLWAVPLLGIARSLGI